MPWYLSRKWPGVLFAFGLVLSLVTDPKVGAGAPFMTVAVLWVLLTGRARKVYWNARLRTRAALDERDSRLGM
ncbi:MAG: hypothetical protein HOQ28_07205 [Thermoleophilia bacterium]|nr:hypothetical protein [Thermoleophilia bacterium]